MDIEKKKSEIRFTLDAVKVLLEEQKYCRLKNAFSRYLEPNGENFVREII